MKRPALGIAAALLAGCAGKPAAPPASPPVAAVPPEPAAAPTVAVGTGGERDWRDEPLSSGEWSYASDGSGSEARFGDGFTLRCDFARREVRLGRPGGAGSLRVRTSFGERGLGAGAALAATDSLLDELAFSRGRFLVHAESLEPLIMPAWPEPARVIEDCRG